MNNGRVFGLIREWWRNNTIKRLIIVERAQAGAKAMYSTGTQSSLLLLYKVRNVFVFFFFFNILEVFEDVKNLNCGTHLPYALFSAMVI